MTLRNVDHGPDPVKPDPTWGEHIADLIERYCNAREVFGAGLRNEAEYVTAKRELAEGIDELVKTIPTCLDDIM